MHPSFLSSEHSTALDPLRLLSRVGYVSSLIGNLSKPSTSRNRRLRQVDARYLPAPFNLQATGHGATDAERKVDPVNPTVWNDSHDLQDVFDRAGAKANQKPFIF